MNGVPYSFLGLPALYETQIEQREEINQLIDSLMCCKNTNYISKPDILCLKISEKEKFFLIFADF